MTGILITLLPASSHLLSLYTENMQAEGGQTTALSVNKEKSDFLLLCVILETIQG